MTSVDPDTRRSRTEPSHRRALLTAGLTDAGAQREVNEDRFHLDVARGLFVVIDGVGGQAAGGKAADVALSMLRERLERETGPVSNRVREAIAIANNEIHRLASTRPEWEGMACVLTVAVVQDGKATIGHVGDTRLYRIREDRIEKITRDHSPVGEREDARELSESQAMRHPRRNEVYRDVGSEPHDSGDPNFIDVDEIPFESDSALLLCTDGLTDLVDSSSIARTVSRLAGDPGAVVRALIDAANDAGGKDNITVVYVEGEGFAAQTASRHAPEGDATRRHTDFTGRPAGAGVERSSARRRQGVRLALVALLALVIGIAVARLRPQWFQASWLQTSPVAVTPVVPASDDRIVLPTGSIAAAIRDAPEGSQIVVEPGEYREQLVLKDHVRVVSRVPRAASIRLPATAPDAETVPAVLANGLSAVELVGFRIVGDSATPLPVGISVSDSAISIADVEITGATGAGIEFSGRGAMTVVGSEIRDNPGAAIIVRNGASPRIAHNSFVRNGLSERSPGALVIEKATAPLFYRNVFLGLNPDSFATLDAAARMALARDNWFLPAGARRPNRAPAPSRTQRKR